MTGPGERHKWGAIWDAERDLDMSKYSSMHLSISLIDVDLHLYNKYK